MVTEMLVAGRELDARIEQLVFGNGVSSMGDGEPLRLATLNPVAYYSTDIAAAWLVVEKMREQARGFTLMIRGDNGWYCAFGSALHISEGSGDTAPLAICRAALAALEHD